jgi:death-on-curing protein
MTPRFLIMEAVQLIQASLIDTYGGAHGLRDEGLLRSALDRAENRYFYEPDTSIATLAASMSWGLIKNHAFLDGNKRVGLGALVVFLELNGHELICTWDEAKEMTVKAATTTLSEVEWTSWVELVTRPITPVFD